jgi:hypothetical protein
MTIVTRSVARPADLPDPQQLDRLLDLVEAAYPQLRPNADEPHHRQHVFNAFRFLVNVRRSEKLSPRYGLYYFLDWCGQFLRDNGVLTGVSHRGLTAAIAASCDIRFSSLQRYPFDIEIGLYPSEASVPSNAWRSFRLLAPVVTNDRPGAMPEFRVSRAQPDDAGGVRVRR